MGKDQPASGFISLGRKRSNPTMYPFYAGGFPLPVNSSLIPPSNPVGFTSCKKSYMVFDQSGDQTSLVFSSGRNGNYVGPEREDSHEEDSEEIDALLYSDFGNESKASTGHSPVQNVTAESSAVLIHHSLPPHKRRRFEPDSYKSELNPSLAQDTASSTFRADNEEDRTKAKRERIQETVGVIRRLIPGRRNAKKKKEEDAVTLLDEAIRYLNSLRLKAKELGGSSL